jgi:hypothetical protein
MNQSNKASAVTSIQWPNGKNSNFLILPVPNVSSSITQNALSYICGNCFYYDKDKTRKQPYIIDIEPSKQLLSKAIQLEALFLNAVGKSVDDPQLVDYRRYQTLPSRQSSLLKSTDIKTIVTATQNVIDAQVDGYVMAKLSILYSLSFGSAQGLHVDDIRIEEDIKKDGEHLSVIFALQDNTKLDIGMNEKMRKTYSIPSGSMFLFSGNCWHGGSVHLTNNARIHMLFVKKGSMRHGKIENLIPVGFQCPVESCQSNVGRIISFTKEQMYNHWRIYHKDQLGISLGKYRQQLTGKMLLQCPNCQKFFTKEEGMKRHQQSRCKQRLTKHLTAKHKQHHLPAKRKRHK